MTLALPVLCICGPSAAGKTTFAASLAAALEMLGRRPLQIACDDYYRADWKPHPLFGFDTVDAIDAAELRLQLSAARYRQLASLRRYDMRTREVGSRSCDPSYDLVLVEGSYGPQLLLEAVPLSLVVYIETPVVQRLIRRLWRDVRERQRPAQYVIRQMLQQMLPGERRFIHPLKNRADVIVRGYNWDLEPVLRKIDTP